MCYWCNWNTICIHVGQLAVTHTHAHTRKHLLGATQLIVQFMIYTHRYFSFLSLVLYKSMLYGCCCRRLFLSRLLQNEFFFCSCIFCNSCFIVLLCFAIFQSMNAPQKQKFSIVPRCRRIKRRGRRTFWFIDNRRFDIYLKYVAVVFKDCSILPIEKFWN